MKNWSRWLVVLGVVVILGLLYFFDGNVTGNVIVNSVLEVDNCSDAAMIDVWEDVFSESFSGAEIFKVDTPVDSECNSYLALKTNEDSKVWYLLIGSSNYYGNESTHVTAFYFNATDSMINDIGGIGNYYDAGSVFDDIGENMMEDVNNWSEEIPINENEAGGKLGQYFLPLDYPWAIGSWEELDTGLIGWSFDYYEEGEFVNDSIEIVVLSNLSFVAVDYLYTDSINYARPLANFTTNITNYTFEANSSWNFAFDIDDHFSYSGGYYSEDILFRVTSEDDDNSLGQLINFTNDSTDVKFMPKVGWNGSRKFQVEVYRINETMGEEVLNCSNTFNVTIVDDINYAPILKKNFESFAISRDDGARVNLAIYFEDPDDDDLTYRITGDDNIDVTFNGSIMTLVLNASFNNTANLRIYASDGEFEKSSNNFYVYEGVINSSVVVLVENETDDINGSISESLISGNVSEGFSNNADNNDSDSNWSKWVLWVVMLVVVLCLILLIIWFFVLKKNGSTGSIGNGSVVAPSGDAPVVPASPVNNYLGNLNLEK